MKTIQFECANCSLPLKVDARAAGQVAECPQCGEPLEVPSPGEAVPPGPEKKQPPVDAPSAPERERLTPKGKFCITCSRDVPDNNLVCPNCGGGRFGRL